MDNKTLEFIKSNIPDSINDNTVVNTFKECNEDVLETISVLLNIPKKPVKEKTDWEKRREICDEHDGEIQKILKSRNNKINNNEI